MAGNSQWKVFFFFFKLKMCFAKLGNLDGIDFGDLGYLLSLNSLDNFFTIFS